MYSYGTRCTIEVGVNKVQECPFKGTPPVTICCTPTGKIFIFSESVQSICFI